jgi:hypothetical protein
MTPSSDTYVDMTSLLKLGLLMGSQPDRRAGVQAGVGESGERR